MEIPKELSYTKEHEWVKMTGDEAVIGITSHAQDELGDVVFVELPKVGAVVKQGVTFGTVESVKAVSDLYAPLSGTVIRVNDKLQTASELVNQEPYGQGWMIAVRVQDPKELGALMDAGAYAVYVGAEKGSH